jgi:hypothetical protein
MISDATLRRCGWSARTVALWGDAIRAIAIGVVLGLATALVYLDVRLLSSVATHGMYRDFGGFYAQAQRAIDGLDPYAPVTPPGGSELKAFRNLNPPHFHLLMMPFGLVPAAAAFGAWIALSVGALIVSLRITLRALRMHADYRTVVWSTILLAAAGPTLAQLATGQVAWMLALPVTAAWACARRGEWTRGGLLLGIAASFKPFLWIFLPYLVLRRRWRAAGAALAGAVALWMAGLVAFGVSAWFGYLNALGSITWAAYIINGSIYGFLERLVYGAGGNWPLAPLPALDTVSVFWGWAALSGAVGAATAWRLSRGPDQDVDRDFLVVLTACLLISPLGWSYYLILLVGPLIAVGRAGEVRNPLFLAAIGVQFIWPDALQAGQPHGLATLTIGSALFWSLLTLWGVALYRGPFRSALRRAPRSGGDWEEEAGCGA